MLGDLLSVLWIVLFQRPANLLPQDILECSLVQWVLPSAKYMPAHSMICCMK